MQYRHSLLGRSACYILVAILCCGFLLVNARAQSVQQQLDQHGRWINGVSEPWWFRASDVPEDDVAKARLRWENIGAENQNAESEWAGDYQIGDLHGAYLRLSAKGSFVLMSVYSCESSVTDVDYGRASVTADLVELFSERSARKHRGSLSHSYHVPVTKYIPVKWDNLYFLVPEKQIAQFAEELAGVGRFNSGASGAEWIDHFWKLTNYSGRSATGLPRFPRSYERYMKEPVDSAIVKVGPRRIVKSRNSDGSVSFESRLQVIIGAGRTAGVRRGMMLHLLNSEGRESMEITYAGPSRSTGVITRTLDENMLETYTDYKDGAIKNKMHTPIGLGERVTSSTYRLP